ncbi:MAG: hypothetical protein AB8H86_05230 [Polyangiales bacterium]
MTTTTRMLFPALLLSLAAFGCDRGPAPQGNAGGGTETPSETTTETPEVEAPAAEAVRPAIAPRRQGAPTVSADSPELAGIAWAVHEPLTWRTPSSAMRNAEYVVGEGAAAAVMTVFHFPGMGGGIEENVARWTGQFQSSEGGPADAAVETKTIGGLEVTTIDTRGTFTNSMPMAGQAGPQGNQRMLGAIVAGPNGPVFFKLIGPEATVGTAEAAFGDLVESFRATE